MNKILFGLVIVFVIIVGVTGATFAYNVSEPTIETLSENKILKAAIIDQLYTDIPNENFHKQSREYLESAGYQVDIFTTEQITIDFYKKLPSYNFDFVLVRTHGASDVNENDSVTLFTGEKYQEDKYITEQLFGQVKRVTPLYEITFDTNDDSDWMIVNDTYRVRSSPAKIATSSSNEYFAITPKLIEQGLEGRFAGTTFVLGGCNTMETTSMAESLVRKGASDVVGWDNQLLASENDTIMLALLEKLFVSKTVLPIAVDSLMEDYPEKWFSYNTRMKYYT